MSKLAEQLPEYIKQKKKELKEEKDKAKRSILKIKIDELNWLRNQLGV